MKPLPLLLESLSSCIEARLSLLNLLLAPLNKVLARDVFVISFHINYYLILTPAAGVSDDLASLALVKNSLICLIVASAAM